MSKYIRQDEQQGRGALWREPDTAKRAELRKAAHKAWLETTRLEAEDERRTLQRSHRRMVIFFWVCMATLLFFITRVGLQLMGEIE